MVHTLTTVGSRVENRILLRVVRGLDLLKFSTSSNIAWATTLLGNCNFPVPMAGKAIESSLSSCPRFREFATNVFRTWTHETHWNQIRRSSWVKWWSTCICELGMFDRISDLAGYPAGYRIFPVSESSTIQLLSGTSTIRFSSNIRYPELSLSSNSSCYPVSGIQ